MGFKTHALLIGMPLGLPRNADELTALNHRVMGVKRIKTHALLIGMPLGLPGNRYSVLQCKETRVSGVGN
jgi:hypothetical protein